MRRSLFKSRLFLLALLVAFLGSVLPVWAGPKGAFMRVSPLKAGLSNRIEANNNPVMFTDPAGLAPSKHAYVVTKATITDLPDGRTRLDLIVTIKNLVQTPNVVTVRHLALIAGDEFTVNPDSGQDCGPKSKGSFLGRGAIRHTVPAYSEVEITVYLYLKQKSFGDIELRQEVTSTPHTWVNPSNPKQTITYSTAIYRDRQIVRPKY